MADISMLPTCVAGGTVLAADQTNQNTAITNINDQITSGNSWVRHFDDFIATPGSTTTNGGGNSSEGYRFKGTSNSSINGTTGTNVDQNHPGVLTLSTDTSSSGYGTVYLSGAAFRLSGGQVSYESLIWIDDLSAVAQEYIIRCGLIDSSANYGGAAVVNGVYFEYDRLNSVNWRKCTADNSTRTETASSTAVAADAWLKLKLVVNTAGTSVEFFVDGSSIGSVATNIPTAAGRFCGPAIFIKKSAGTTARTVSIDYADLVYTVTTAR